jgi:glycosyltransferase involved in cell wall biosynthesis
MQHDDLWMSEVMEADTGAHALLDYKDRFDHGDYRLLTVSTWLQQEVNSRYGIQSTLIPNGIDLDIFKPQKPLLAKDRLTIAVNYDPQIWKGFTEAALAFLEVAKDKQDIRLIVMGRYFPEVPQNTGLSYGFPFPVIYFNRPDQNDIPRFYASADVFVSSSWKEGFGLPGLEAMACGVATVTTDSGGIREYAKHEKNALIVPPNDVSALAANIRRMITEPKLRQNLAKNGRTEARSHEWTKSIVLLEKAFQGI